jgi:hypothetical protein
MNSRRSCVDGPRLARDNFAFRTEVACSSSGLFTQSGWTGPDGGPRTEASSFERIGFGRPSWIVKADWLDANGLKSNSVAEPKARRPNAAGAVVVPVNRSKNSQEQVRCLGIGSSGRD